MIREPRIHKGPTPIDEEVIWDKTQSIVSRSDLFGTIDWANETFATVSGYEEHELMGIGHNAVRHPDMPEVIFKVLWDNIKLGNQFRIIVKNLARSGRYYWVISDFEYVRDETGKITNYISRRDAAPNEVLEGHIIPLYKKLLQIEEAGGIKASEKYLTGMLYEKGLSFSDFTSSLMANFGDKYKFVQVAKITPIANVDNEVDFNFNNVTTSQTMLDYKERLVKKEAELRQQIEALKKMPAVRSDFNEEAREVKKGFFRSLFGW